MEGFHMAKKTLKKAKKLKKTNTTSFQWGVGRG
jgi:hypothetical protein